MEIKGSDRAKSLLYKNFPLFFEGEGEIKKEGLRPS